MLQAYPISNRWAPSSVRVAEANRSLAAGFGRAMARLRHAAGYSEEQMAARAGLHPAEIVAFERGERPVSLLLMERIAGALGLRVSDLVREAERDD